MQGRRHTGANREPFEARERELVEASAGAVINAGDEKYGRRPAAASVAAVYHHSASSPDAPRGRAAATPPGYEGWTWPHAQANVEGHD